jgi:hypothetical protein
MLSPSIHPHTGLNANPLTAPTEMSSWPKLRLHFDTSPTMTTLNPREPYSPEELAQLYPKSLKLQLVQVVSFPKLYSSV